MQKSTKRLLSMLVVLALVLGFAPAGILAVETKAAASDTNWTAAVNNGGLSQAEVAAEQAKQTAAVAALNQLTGATMEARCTELMKVLPTCPFCNQKVTEWYAVNTSIQYGGTTTPQHFYAYGTISKTGDTAWLMSRTNSKACVLLDETAVINAKGRVDMLKGDNVVNIGGLGKFVSDMFSAGANGMFQLASANATLNLYGGTFINTYNNTAADRPLINIAHDNATVNVWTGAVVIGPETSQEAHTTTKPIGYCNVNMTAGTLNMYGGTIRNAYSRAANQGWNVFMQGGTFNMYDGTILGGSGCSGASGSNVHCRSTFNMYGGEISGGKTNSYYGGGANLYVGTGPTGGTAPAKIPVATLYGGTISGGTNYSTNGHGANINVGSINNATTETSNGYGKLVITGTALVENGKGNGTDEGGGRCRGGNIYVNQGCQLEITGGTVKGGKASYGGNIALGNAVNATITGCAINSGSILVGGGTLTIDPVNDNVAVAGIGTVQGVDVANDDFAGHSGSITATGVTVAKDATYNDKHYIALKNGNAYTFHRLEITNKAFSINRVDVDAEGTPLSVGARFKTEIKFDAVVAERVKLYGAVVALDRTPVYGTDPETSSSDLSAKYYNAETHTLSLASHGVKNILKVVNTPATNQTNSGREIHSIPYIIIDLGGQGGEYRFEGTKDAYSLQSILNHANGLDADDLSPIKASLKSLVEAWNKADYRAWPTEFVSGLTNIMAE